MGLTCIDPNLAEVGGVTPLHYAAKHRRCEVSSLLLSDSRVVRK
jgi:ankyrin repeat protein